MALDGIMRLHDMAGQSEHSAQEIAISPFGKLPGGILMAIICLAVFKLFGEKIKEKISGYSDTVDQIETSSQ